jgi:hypothetical protein
VGNIDETGIQREVRMQKGVMPRGIKVAYRPTDSNKESVTCIAFCTAAGQMLDPQYIVKGKKMCEDLLGTCQYYRKSAVHMKQDTHMIDGKVWQELLRHLATAVIPGGVSPSNRFLLVVDGHESRLSLDSVDQARDLGFDIIIMPGQCTHFMQPLDQVFGTIKAQYSRLFTEHVGTAEGQVKLSKHVFLSLIDSAIHNAVTDKPAMLKDAFVKTGLFPPCLDTLLAAAKAVTPAAVDASGAGEAGADSEQGGESGGEDEEPSREAQQIAAAKRPVTKRRLAVNTCSFITSDRYRNIVKQHEEAKAAAEAEKASKRAKREAARTAKAQKKAAKAKPKPKRQGRGAAKSRGNKPK